MITLEIVYSQYEYGYSHSDTANMYIETAKYAHCISDGISIYDMKEFKIDGYKYKALII